MSGLDARAGASGSPHPEVRAERASKDEGGSETLDAKTVLVRPRWARLQRCAIRDQWLLLVPERVLFPCPTTTEILMRLDRPRALGALADELAEEYDAPAEAILADITALLGDLVEKGYVRRADA